MSYIVPREKPNCMNCLFRDCDDCKLTGKEVTMFVNTMTTSPYCPLVDVKTMVDVWNYLKEQIEVTS